MAEAPPEEELLKAVSQCLGPSRQGASPVLQGPRIVRSQIVEFAITWSVETRAEKERTEHGSIDLSSRPRYEGAIEDHPVDPPKNPATARRLTLVLRDSERESVCACDDGRIQCPRCLGRGRHDCAPTAVCADCLGVDSCTACGDTGKRRRERGRPSSARPAPGSPSERITCATCGRREAACAGCRGRGITPCAECAGRGTVSCDHCESSGLVAHPACGGKGRTTSWTEGTVRHTPGGERLSLPLKRAPYPVRRRMERDGDWHSAVLTGFRKLPDEVASEHRPGIERLLVRRKGEVARRVDLRSLALARVEIMTEPDRIFYVFPGRERTEVVPLPSRRRVSRLTTMAVGLATVLVLVVSLLR
ncbi:hypothetical protein [Streptomyces sp. AK02-01A]|uniref:hypothetical protein n=1 Tax=Streptomyces sp. AK02-01A TaxID=3028648 RepID=UPI00299FC387|nr:hypothetical protein [Streptomyces sp. AK02-01A]MDX3854481.1 hypothetical protein [Streptomyces sp. AK02-01A]